MKKNLTKSIAVGMLLRKDRKCMLIVSSFARSDKNRSKLVGNFQQVIKEATSEYCPARERLSRALDYPVLVLL